MDFVDTSETKDIGIGGQKTFHGVSLGAGTLAEGWLERAVAFGRVHIYHN